MGRPLKRPVKVAVIYGGRSCEHDVSVSSAQAVAHQLGLAGFETICIPIARSGQWLPPAASPRALTSLEQGILPSGQGLSGSTQMVGAIEEWRGGVDVVFPVLHGPYGEDGTLQGMLQLAGIPFVGSDVLGSALGMDKGMLKAIVSARGIQVARHLVISREESRQDVERRCRQELTPPLFVKPNGLGSSIGVTRVESFAQLGAALDTAAVFDSSIIVEEAVADAREIEIGVIGNTDIKVSVPGEVRHQRTFYDYQAKYHDDATQTVIPARLTAKTLKRIERDAKAAFRALKLSGLARMDFLVRARDEEVFFLEPNTMPGFTPTSMFPKLWEASGIPFPELLRLLVELAMNKHAERERSNDALSMETLVAL